MNKKLTPYYIFIFLFIQAFSLSAQNENSLQYDRNGPVEVRSSEKIQEFLNDKDFQYDKEIVKAPESWLQKILEKILRYIGDFFRLIDEGGNAVSVIFYILIFGILVFVIIKLLGFKYQGLFIRSSKIKDSELEVFDEDIHSVNFEEIIELAIQKENFRLAVRYMYIKFLKILTDHELIEWEKNKTNKDYYKEMRKTEYFSVFKRLTFVYDYVWYGEFPVNRSQFVDYQAIFNKMYKEIK